MSIKQIAILCGGGSTEHEISLISSKYIFKQLQQCCQFQTTIYELENRNSIRNLPLDNIDFVIPAVHGRPGESGEIAAFLDLHGIPYLGCRNEASQICFNKVTTKLWLEALGIPHTPYTFLTDPIQQRQAKEFFAHHHDVYVKAASQGSSVGCYHVTKIEDLEDAITQAFTFSQYVLIEKALQGRELEVAVYQYPQDIHVTKPGEILTAPGQFYSYEEKYSDESQSQTVVEAPLNLELSKKIQDYARRAFVGLKLRHLSRIDFFLTTDHQIYLNEINTFPGMTPISMFPKMLEHNGDKIGTFFEQIIEQALK
jgi:D-alanine-D-alanine ligase